MLTSDDVRTLRDVGYLRKRSIIDPHELKLLRDVCDLLLEEPLNSRSAFAQDFKRPALDQPIGRIEYLFEKDPIFLALAAHPAILNALHRLYEAEAVVTWEDLMIKAARVGFLVYHHQDSLFQCRRSSVYRFGIYLDRSHAAPVRFIPGSHRLGALSAAQIAEVVAASGHEEQAVAAEPGDIVVHDTMLIHSSEIHRDAVARRVIYFEYRTLQQLRSDSPWGSDWIARRRKLVPLGVSLRAAISTHPFEPPSPSQVSSTVAGWPAFVRPIGLDCSTYRVEHNETENLAWHGLPLPENLSESQPAS